MLSSELKWNSLKVYFGQKMMIDEDLEQIGWTMMFKDLKNVQKRTKENKKKKSWIMDQSARKLYALSNT